MSAREPSPRWARELRRQLPVRTQFFLYGNVHDRFPYDVGRCEGEPSWAYLNVRDYLHRFLRDAGFKLVLFYDVVDGVTFLDAESEKHYRIVIETGAKNSKGRDRARTDSNRTRPEDVARVMREIRTLLTDSRYPTSAIIDFATLLGGRPDDLTDQERQIFLQLAKAAREAVAVRIGDAQYRQLSIFIAERLNDLPAWLYLNNPLARTLQLDRPDEAERRRYFDMTFGRLHDAQIEGSPPRTLIDQYCGLTQGMMNTELDSVIELSRRERIPADRPKEIVEAYKFGVVRSPWAQLIEDRRETLATAQETLGKRVKGQPAAIRVVADIITRAALGLSGVQHSALSQKPKGVLFFAGPTGVGKTELAKALAELLFGDESTCARFDMSEYGQPQSDQRLFGAPPGYVGYEEGGELTNRVKENPFCVLLFDEIEKAHPSILDKFLQILEDGRMTSGQGETIYFSETVIIFTSNKGMHRDIRGTGGLLVDREPTIRFMCRTCRECGEIRFDEPRTAKCKGCGADAFEERPTLYAEIRSRILAALETYFKLELGRPELYNRIGNNFVVFDYIRPVAARAILDKMLGVIRSEILRKRGVEIDFSRVTDSLAQAAAEDLELGGRGVGNMLETRVVNPLARQLFESDVASGTCLVIEAVVEQPEAGGSSWRLEWKQA